MNKAERTERNIRIALMHMRDASNAEIADTVDLTERQVRRVIAEWDESPLKLDTKEAAETVIRALQDAKDDMNALGVTAAAAPPEARIEILVQRIDLLNQVFSVMKRAGVSFEGVFDGSNRDPDLVVDVNAAIREKLVEHGVDNETITEAIDAGLDVYADWGFPIPKLRRN